LYHTPKTLRQATTQVAHQQREVYRSRRKDDKTRLELHPELKDNHRPYRRSFFDIGKVYDYLLGFVWQRKVQANGTIKLFGQAPALGYKWRGQNGCVTFGHRP
jgi:hypothetical protein